jgi:hypothetical protein
VSDNVTQPKHYTSAGIECIDAIEAALGPDGFRAYCIGNVIKYNWRHKLKNGNEDLRKAKVYQAWAAAGTAAEKPEATEARQYASAGTALLDRQFEAATAGPALNHAGGDIEE